MTRPTYTRSTTAHGKTPVKASRPPSLKLSRQATSHKSPPGSAKSKRHSQTDFEDSDGEMSGLPHFCATCEKQIITPNASILYCSTACRRKDGSRPSSVLELNIASPSPTDLETLATYPDIVPRQSPTAARPSSIASSDGDSFYERPAGLRSQSEAAKYLSQFMGDGQGSSSRRHSTRPNYYRNQNSASSTTLPSLSHTPGSSAASSYNSYMSRTIPTRLPPWSLRHNSARSIELVIPVSAPNGPSTAKPLPVAVPMANDGGISSLTSSVSTATLVDTAEMGLTYEKRSLEQAVVDGKGSLKQLLATEPSGTSLGRGSETAPSGL